MPNHTETRLTVIGSHTNVTKFIEAAHGDETALDFEKLYPSPKDNTDWYNWSVSNWGTKWNAYNVGIWAYSKDNENTIATLNYQTAWSPATKLFLNISPNYPELQFTHEFIDEGGSFIGYETIANGKIIEAKDYEWDDVSSITLRRALNVYYEEEEEEDV